MCTSYWAQEGVITFVSPVIVFAIPVLMPAPEDLQWSFPNWNRNSVNSADSGNLINH